MENGPAKRFRPLVALLGLGMAATCGTAAAEGLAGAAKIGTLGLGVEVTKAIMPKANLRLGVNHYTYSTSTTHSGVDYNIDLKLRSVSALFDWYPTGREFRFTAGVLYNDNKLEGRAKTDRAITIGDTTYPAGTTLNGDASFNRGSPYLGVGWGNLVGKNKKFSVSFDLGIVYQGAPDVTLSSSAGVSQSDLDKERDQLKSDLDDLRNYPVIVLSLGYQF